MEDIQTNKIRLINTALIGKVKAKAIESPRKRMNHNFHELDETYQRFLNILCKGTYVRPHRHTNPPKAETFLILEGKISFLIFSDEGEIIESHILQADGNNYGIDILPGVWHSLVCISDTAVCFEGKHGPYNPPNDKDFASWAPLENTEEAKQYLNLLGKKINF